MSCFDSSFSNNGNFESFVEIFVKVENSNDCFDFVGGITIDSLFVSFGFSKLNHDFEILCFDSLFVSFNFWCFYFCTFHL